MFYGDFSELRDNLKLENNFNILSGSALAIKRNKNSF